MGAYYGSRGVAIWKIFEFLGRLVIYYSYQVNQFPEYNHIATFFTYTKKDYNASTEVWKGTWPSRAPIMVPGGRDLEDF
jgi:hypothetical protein